MAVVPGRSSAETRTATITTTSSSTAITAAAGTFMKGDVGAAVSAASGISAGTTISAVASDTAATLSANATASGSRSATIGPGTAGVYGFRGWSPESDTERLSRAAVPTGTPPEVLSGSNLSRLDYQRAR